MEKKAFIVCGVVGFLGLLAAATSFGAEATRIKVCVFRSSLAFLEYPATKDPSFALFSVQCLLGLMLVLATVKGTL